MKLYATVTSERATKGQGGEELYINITNEKKQLEWAINILSLPDGTPTMEIVELDREVTQFFSQRTKGKRQKGEHAKYSLGICKGTNCEKCGKCEYCTKDCIQ